MGVYPPLQPEQGVCIRLLALLLAPLHLIKDDGEYLSISVAVVPIGCC